jgi:hypothetical protein
MTTDRGGALWERSDLWSLREDVQVESGTEDEPVRLHSRWGEVAIKRPTRAIREALSRMTLGPISLQNIVSVRGEPSTELTQLLQVLDQLQPLVIRTLGFDTGQPLLSVVPLTPEARFRLTPVPPDARVRLSAFAEVRTNGQEYSWSHRCHCTALASTGPRLSGFWARWAAPLPPPRTLRRLCRSCVRWPGKRWLT